MAALAKAPEPPAPRSEHVESDDPIIRVYVWELPVRLVHWTIFFALVVLSLTGYYLHNPFFVVGGQRSYTLATMRFIHEVTAFVFTSAFLLRIYWFFAGNAYARWRAFVPVTRQQRRGVSAMLRYYLFLRWVAPDEVGHNPLAAVMYLLVYVLFLIQILTGFALYGWIVNTPPLSTLFGWLPRLINIQYLRETHYFLMFIFFAFTVHHVYSALLVSIEAANGLMGSIFSGHKFVPRSVLRKEESRDRN